MSIPKFTLMCAGLLTGVCALAAGNTTNDSYPYAKKVLEREVYFDHRVTLYCGARFNSRKDIDLPPGFRAPAKWELAKRVEWEHVVPAENFGQHFPEWRYGSDRCVKGGRPYKGRRCADFANRRFRLMQADMYNLFPSIGTVNALRSNYRFTQYNPARPSTFGSCPMKIDFEGRSVEPPEASRGEIARATLYMAWAYAQDFNLSATQRKLFERWDRTYPVTPWECKRAKRIERAQRNENPFVKESCRRLGLW